MAGNGQGWFVFLWHDLLVKEKMTFFSFLIGSLYSFKAHTFRGLQIIVFFKI